jgi:hypothetical protein
MSDDFTAPEQDAPAASASVVGSGWDTIKSGAYAVGDLAEAGFDVAVAGSDGLFGVVTHLEAGILDAVGAEGAAAFMRDTGNKLQDAGVFMLGEAGKELTEVKEDLIGR